ncbi:MAG: hypothetical protein KKH22_12570, partial [Proteobacteria bacterium]|nr:hypothetical protein [Pseudomonadota bacterium]
WSLLQKSTLRQAQGERNISSSITIPFMLSLAKHMFKASSVYYLQAHYNMAVKKQLHLRFVTIQQRRFAAATDARKRPAKCAIAHELADDKADVVLLNGYLRVRRSQGLP